MGKFLVVFIVLSAILTGGGIYYLQVYSFYETVTLSDNPTQRYETQIKLTLLETGQAEPIPIEDFQGIDADSSPLRFRACFTAPQILPAIDETYVAYDDPIPLYGPGWFDCFDAAQIGGDLEQGIAQAYLSEANIVYGFDRVMAIYDDGRAYMWHQINRCGAVVFEGNPAPEGCPAPPVRTN